MVPDETPVFVVGKVEEVGEEQPTPTPVDSSPVSPLPTPPDTALPERVLSDAHENAAASPDSVSEPTSPSPNVLGTDQPPPPHRHSHHRRMSTEKVKVKAHQSTVERQHVINLSEVRVREGGGGGMCARACVLLY